VVNYLRPIIRMIGDIQCSNPINNSMLIRIALSIISLYFLSVSNNNFIIRHIYLILPILLIILDLTDNIYTRSFKYKGNDNGCTKTFNYQFKDKVVDVASYFYTYFLFPYDKNILYFSIYRLFGVILFYLTKSSKWLLLFFDFVKEYMVYIYLFKDNYKYLPFVVIAKIIFEYYFHSFINKREY
jgi:hypothetical protein